MKTRWHREETSTVTEGYSIDEGWTLHDAPRMGVGRNEENVTGLLYVL